SFFRFRSSRRDVVMLRTPARRPAPTHQGWTDRGISPDLKCPSGSFRRTKLQPPDHRWINAATAHSTLVQRRSPRRPGLPPRPLFRYRHEIRRLLRRSESLLVIDAGEILL